MRAASSPSRRCERLALGRSDADPESDKSTRAKDRVKAHIMIQADPLRVHEVLTEVQSLKGVTEAHELAGPFDIVALVEADSIADLAPLLHKATSTMPGVFAAAAVVGEAASENKEGGEASG